MTSKRKRFLPISSCSGKPQEPSCDCWHETDDKLRKHGFKIADACSGFAVDREELRITVQFGLPIQRLDKTEKRRGDPNIIVISHCPFCGAPLNQPAGTKGGER